MALLSACIECHVKPFKTGDFRKQLQEAFMEMKTFLSLTHPFWAGLREVLFDLNIPESPEHNPDELLRLALEASFLKAEAPAVDCWPPWNLACRHPPSLALRNPHPVVG